MESESRTLPVPICATPPKNADGNRRSKDPGVVVVDLVFKSGGAFLV